MATSFYFKTASDQPDFTTEVAIRDFEPARPYPQNPQAIVYRTRFMQLRAYYTRPTVNTPHPSLPQVYFADDIDFQDRPGGVVEWTRVYVTIPTQWNDYSSEAYNYPGFQGTLITLGRNPFTHIVTTKMVKDYYLVGALQTIQTSFSDYDNLAGANWITTGITKVANAAAVPVCAGGGNYAALMTANGSGLHSVYQSTVLGTGSFCVSVFAKKVNSNGIQVQLGTNGNGIYADARIDLNTGQPIGTPQGAWGVAAIGEGWWRINVSGNAGSANSALTVLLLNSSDTNSFSASSESVYLWRAQMMTGLTARHSTVPPTVASDGTTNYPLTTADQIPQTFAQRYFYSGFVNGAGYIAEFLSDNGFGLLASNPTKTNYNANVVTDQGNTNSYSIESQDSVQSLWYGSVWERERKFVKAR